MNLELKAFGSYVFFCIILFGFLDEEFLFAHPVETTGNESSIINPSQIILAQGNSFNFDNLEELKFDEYFTDETMRIDYFHKGDAKSDEVTLDKIYRYGVWAGNPDKLIDRFNNGRYYAKIYDLADGKLIYSKGFDNYFFEYQTTEEAANGAVKSFHETLLIPYPKKEIIYALEKRNKNNKLEEIFRTQINPLDKGIELFEYDESVIYFEGHRNRGPANHVDLVVVGEGYSNDEMEKFRADFNRFYKAFFSIEPYASHRSNFNVFGVLKTSEESGVDEPDAEIYKNSVLGATFGSLGSERYLLTEDNKKLRDIAATVPYDAILIMVNSARYGGGGIYNFYCTFTSDNQFFDYLILHEFGHSFSGLADEYYTSDVAYSDFYPDGVEPTEPNITSLPDLKNIKWKYFISPDIELPTPWEKDDFDSMNYKWQRERKALNNKIAELKKNKAPKAEIDKAEKDYADKDRKQSILVDIYLKKCEMVNQTGAFEGAGYASKGLYRPMLDCIMFTKGKKPYCKVCEAAVLKIIEHYSGKYR